VNAGRALVALVGIGSLAGALALLFAPSSDALGGLATALTGFPAGTVARALLTLVFGALTLFAAFGDGETWEPTAPDPETVSTDRRTAGSDFDAALDRLRAGDTDDPEVRARVRAEVHAVATAVLESATDDVDAPASDRLADGSWTDDPRAAAFLGEDVPQPPLSVRFRDWLSAEPTFERRVRVTLAALDDHVEEVGQ
jgi:hypothetical protein